MRLAVISGARVFFISASLALVLCGCGGQNQSANTNINSQQVSSAPGNSSSSSPSPETTPQSAASAGQSGTEGKVSLRSNLYFVFDGSGSMHHPPKASPAGSRSKIDGAKWAVHEFMKNVPENVNLGLYVFDARGSRSVLPLGPANREVFLRDIDEVRAGGATPLGKAIETGANALAHQYTKQLGYGEFKLIVITDGEATDLLASGVNKAASEKIPIYTIGFDMGNDHSLRRHSVAYRSADSAAEVEKGLEEAVAELDVFDAPSFKKVSQ